MNKGNRLSYIILGVIIVVTAVLLVMLMSNISEVAKDPKMNTWISTSLTWAYILFFLAAGLALIFALLQLFADFKSAKGSLFGVGFMVIVVLVSYFLASGDMPKFPGVQKFIDDGTLTPNVSKWVDTGLITCYFLIGIAILSLIFSSLSRYVRK
jgi:DMSO reductase anchor subunit